MSDNLTRYYAVHSALRQLCPQEPRGNHARQLRTLAHLVSGIVGSRRANLPAVASKAPDGNQRESRVKRFTRWVQNERIDAGTYFLPYVQVFLSALPSDWLVLVIDSSPVGRGCMALVVSVLYRKRALPIAWTVVRGKRGHVADAVHVHLIREVATLLANRTDGPNRPNGPDGGRGVIVLGDAEFDGLQTLEAIRAQGWHFVCRTGPNVIATEEGQDFRLSWLNVEPGDRIELADVFFMQKAFGPVLVALVWEPHEDRPLYLVSSLDLMEEACFWYRKRFQIETFFSDQKSRGFYMAHSHLSDPLRLQRLLIATCLAYIWLVCLGDAVRRKGWTGRIHRKSRCDLSLFQLGLLWLEHCLNEDWAVPVFFDLAPEPQLKQPDNKSVR